MQLQTIRHAAARLAVSPVTVRRLIAANVLPFVRIGRCVRVRAEDVNALIGGQLDSGIPMAGE
ncbi:MAG: helix-turn-helix domain-containing protein [Nitrospiraceae bacterium]